MNPQPKVAHYSQMAATLFGDSAPGTSIRELVSEQKDGAPVYNMRMIEIEPNGNTPPHSHPYEHENYVLEGEGQVFLNDEWHSIKPGYVILVPPNMHHQYRNTGSTVFRFLCSIPVEKFQGV